MLDFRITLAYYIAKTCALALIAANLVIVVICTGQHENHKSRFKIFRDIVGRGLSPTISRNHVTGGLSDLLMSISDDN